VGFITFFLFVVLEEARPLLPWGRAGRERRLAAAWQQQLTLSVNGWRKAPRRLTVTPEGVAEVSEASYLQYDWSAVWAIVRLPDHVLVLLSSEGGLVVPRRAFHSDEHFREFVALAEQYRLQALTTVASTRPVTSAEPGCDQ
jgi:YcxB-like protein